MAKSLDQIIQQLSTQTENSPFVIGEQKSKEHPVYRDLINFSKMVRAEIKWSPSVSAAVLKLPFHPDRMQINPNDEFDGWFDEFSSPNKIIIHNKAALIILIHELRHALHLGSHPLMGGNSFDRLLQKNKRIIDQFKQQVMGSHLSRLRREKLFKAATRLIETCSEISAHAGDLKLSQVYHRSEAQAYTQYIQDYKKEFMQNYKRLKNDSFSAERAFVDELYVALQEFMNDRFLPW